MNWRNLWQRMTDLPSDVADAGTPKDEFQPQADAGKLVKLGGGLLLGGLAAFLLWATFAPLDQGIPAQGIVMVDTKRKIVQHLTGGLIEKVFVREGQQVNAGDVLIKLDEAQARADFESARQRYLGLRANEDRLIAEQTWQTKISFHPDIVAEKDSPQIRLHMQTQEQLLYSRRQALNSELASMNEAIQSQQEAAKGFSAQLQSRKQQISYVIEERGGLRELVAEGYAPRNKLLEVERMASEIEATISDLIANLAKAKRSAAELSLRKLQREQEFRKDVDTQLAELRKEVSADEERYRATRDALARTEIKAPTSGAVIGIATQTVGGVIAPGTRIMDIVPKDEVLMLEAQISPQLIDHVRVGQLADIHFSNFSQTPQLVVEGRLASISADLLTDPANNITYYLARISVTGDGLKTLGNHHLQPGMPADVVIKTGERSLMSYLLHPLLRRFSQALKEE